jgi:hypothetical protein
MKLVWATQWALERQLLVNATLLLLQKRRCDEWPNLSLDEFLGVSSLLLLLLSQLLEMLRPNQNEWGNSGLMCLETHPQMR